MMDDYIIDLVNGCYQRIDQSLKSKEFLNYPLEIRVNNFQTINLKLPRGFGVTSAAIQLLNIYKDSVLVVPNSKILDHIVRSPLFSSRNQLYTLDNFLQSGTFKNSWDIVIYDPYTYFQIERLSDIKEIERINAYLAKTYNTKLFLNLG